MNMSADTPARMRLATLCASAALAAPLAVQADALIDPDGTGATRVFPSQATTTTGDLAGERLVIGFSDGEGTLEVNAEAEVNGVTSLVNVGDLEIAQRDNERGELRVVGNGSAGSASVYQSGDFRLGANSDSFLSILDGGQFFSNNSAADNGAFGLLIGSYAQAWHLRDGLRVNDRLHNWRAYGENSFVLPHPSWRNTAWIKRNPWFETELIPALQARIGQIRKTAYDPA